MRLGQLARKYDISSQEIISFINKIDPTHPALHNNSKLEEQLEAVVIKHFDEFLGLTSEPLEVVEQNIIEEEHGEKNPDLNDPVLSDDQEDEVEELTQSDPDPIQEPAETLEAPEAKGESIDTDRLLELLDSEDGDVDLSNITLIKAPKKELSGLKVVGKIELKEPKVKSKENKASEEKDTASERKNSRQFRGLSEEEREERRLRADRKSVV